MELRKVQAGDVPSSSQLTYQHVGDDEMLTMELKMLDKGKTIDAPTE